MGSTDNFLPGSVNGVSDADGCSAAARDPVTLAELAPAGAFTVGEPAPAVVVGAFAPVATAVAGMVDKP